MREFCQKHSIELIEIDGRKYFDYKLKKYIIENIIPMILHNTNVLVA